MIILEKDHFKDRTDETKMVDEVKIGDFCYICEKYKQPFAEELYDLTFGQVIQVLTKHNHERGIKVVINRYCTNPNLLNNSKKIDDTFLMNRTAIGRIVYLTDNGKILKK